MHDEALTEEVRALVNEQAAQDLFSGTLLVAHHQQVLVTAACGYAIHPNLLPNQVDTKFNIASVTKMLTAVAIMRLVAEGKLELHEVVSHYNPNLPHAGEITIHQLLTHTAGFDRYWNDAYRAARSDLRTIDDYLKLFALEPLLFAPGTGYHYGNTGYVILGALIEQVTGESYFDHMRRSIYVPLGMSDTDHFELDMPVHNCAVGYTRGNWFGPQDGQLRANTFIYAIKGSPSEHCYSTVNDLFRFCQALEAGRLLDTRLLEMCFTPQAASEQPGVSYGYGFHIIDDGKHGRVVGHGGRGFGVDAFALMYRDLGYTVIALSNYDRPAARRVVNQIADLLIG
jgi:CubicO group peptidase (beta-lactamase class C family)